MVGRTRRFRPAGSAEPAARVPVAVALSPWSGLPVLAQLPEAVVVLALPAEFPAIAAGLSTAVILGAIDVSGSKPNVRGIGRLEVAAVLCVLEPLQCVSCRFALPQELRCARRFAITVQQWVSSVCLGLYTV